MRIFAALSLVLIGILMNACAVSKTNQSAEYVTPWTPVNTPGPNQPLDHETTSSGRIAFSSERNGLSQIFVMDADGSNVIRLTDAETMHILQATQPTWSPDGQTLAVTVGGSGMGTSGIYLIDVYTLDIQRIPDVLNSASGPTWSPDGRQIAFIADRNSDDSSTDIYVMNKDGSNVTRQTKK